MTDFLDNFSGSIADFLEQVSRCYGPLPAYRCLGESLSYNDVDRLSRQFAAYLQHSDLSPGDRVAIQLPNILQYPVVVFAVLRAGMVLVNVNPQYTARELKHQLEDSGAKALVVLENFADVSVVTAREVGLQYIYVARVADLHSPAKRLVINAAAKYLKRSVPDYNREGTISF